MIRYFTTNDTNNEQLTKIKNLCSSSYDGMVVSQDKRKIYYQAGDNSEGFSIGESEFLINTNSITPHNVYGKLLEPGMKYIQGIVNNVADQEFYVPLNSFGLKIGDTVELYLQKTCNLFVKNSNGTSIFRDNGGDIIPSIPVSVGDNSLTLIKIVYVAAGIWTGYVAGGGSALSFATNTWANISAGWEENKTKGQPVSIATIYDSVSGLLTEQKFWNDNRYYFNGSILTGANSIAPSTIPYAKYESSTTPTIASAGVVTLLNVETGLDSGYSNGILTGRLDSWTQPLNAMTTVRYVHGQKYQILSTIFNDVQYTESIGMQQGAQASLVRTNILPSAAPDGTYGIVTTNSGFTSAAISASPDVWVASSAYKFISGVVKDLDFSAALEDLVSAVTFNGTKHESVDHVVDIGTISTQINNHVISANTNNLIDLGNNFVEITQGTPTVGYYVQRTVDGYKLDPGITTLSSSYNTANNNILTVDGNAIPVMIQTNLGNIYPLEKGSLSAGTGSDAGKFLIDIRPYLAYDNVASFTGPWTVYYGAGINNLYTTANTVTNAVVNTSTHNILFSEADVHVLTFNGTGEVLLTVPDDSTTTGGLPKGHGIVIKIINNGPSIIKFGGDTLVTTAGEYSASFFNFGAGTERVGEVVSIY